MATTLSPSIFFVQVTLCVLTHHVPTPPKNEVSILNPPAVSINCAHPGAHHETSPTHHGLKTAPPVEAYKEDRAMEFLRGHGGTAMATTLSPSIFFVQVTLCVLTHHVPTPPKNEVSILNPPAVSINCAHPGAHHETSPTHQGLKTAPPVEAYKEDRAMEFLRGHGGTAMATTLSPSIFFVQVCDKHASCFRSNYRCIVVLPCPATIECLIVDAWSVILIFLSGDVEQNPGPQGIEELKVMMNAMLTSQNDLKTRIVNLAASQEKLESTVNARMNEVMTALQEHKGEIRVLQGEVTSFRNDLQLQQKRLDDLENRSRRRNLVIFGFPEPDRENTEALRSQIIQDLIGQKLGVTVSSVERVHRIGKKQTDKPRPVIINFFDYNEKLKVLKNCNKLKGTTISINHDFCKGTLAKRSKLWSKSGDFKARGRKVVLDYDKLRVDDDLYEWDEQNDCLKCIRSQERRNDVD
ncbi:uncharacterized protein LOC115314240 [Ixodes scapularis]|uniref:uncharacterized protein LOC115314240 n=1 Tax=Ixodes scapularis TaxID=6945 RepID=UPI001A9F31BD|nr:uncharacterized protein LOC115314240 [Ixodes scapularis]